MSKFNYIVLCLFESEVQNFLNIIQSLISFILLKIQKKKQVNLFLFDEKSGIKENLTQQFDTFNSLMKIFEMKVIFLEKKSLG